MLPVTVVQSLYYYRYVEGISFPCDRIFHETIDDVTVATYLHCLATDPQFNRELVVFHSNSRSLTCICEQLDRACLSRGSIQNLIFLPFVPLMNQRSMNCNRCIEKKYTLAVSCLSKQSHTGFSTGQHKKVSMPFKTLS